MDARAYLKHTGLEGIDVVAVQKAQQAIGQVLEDAKRRSTPASPSSLDRLYLYRVPQMSADGSCSIHHELNPVPYDVAPALGGRSIGASMSLMTLDALVSAVHLKVMTDWLGIYQARAVAAGRALVKLAYRGLESRAEFPLTEAFAQTSNNSAVGLTGKPRLIQDLHSHRESGGAYYECDPKIQSEFCLPLFNSAFETVGIIDAESTKPSHFTNERLALLTALAIEVPKHLPQ
jgi:L-methionine (R)-S-oxide reductase